MPENDPSKDAGKPGFDAQKTLREIGGQTDPPREANDITMGVDNADFERRRKREEQERREKAARGRLQTVDERSYVNARILWPALGFPAVISPAGASPDDSSPTRSLWLLIVSDKKNLHKGDVARHLRWVEWEQRHTRWLPSAENGGTNAFREEDLNVTEPFVVKEGGGLTDVVSFAFDHEGENGIMVGLSRFVRDFYATYKMRYLHQVQIYPSAAARLAPAAGSGGAVKYNLFWINENENDKPDKRSAEMELLIEKFARFSRFGHDGVVPADKLTKKSEPYVQGLLSEYEFDYAPQLGQRRTADNRTESLHPVFVRAAASQIRIGHLTDLHFDTRLDAYEQRLRASSSQAARTAVKDYNNWNTTTRLLYERARKTCDVLLLTGDLIDYGRAYNDRAKGADGLPGLGDDKSYWRDRNWFLFYAEMASGANYEKPIYTILGNHDWRLHPYAPFAQGAPAPEQLNLTDDATKVAHGPGYGGKYKLYEGHSLGKVAQIFWHKWFLRRGTMEIKGTPLETNTSSVAWYLLLINPFLDYSFPLPGGYDLLMLDWAENEKVDHHEFRSGVDRGGTLLMPNTGGEPVPKDTLSGQQAMLVEHFVEARHRAKVFGIHAPVVGPHGEWTDDYLRDGKVLTPLGTEVHRGGPNTEVRPDPKPPKAVFRHIPDPKNAQIKRPYLEHPALALLHNDYKPWNWVANGGTPLHRRDWLIARLRKANVQLVLSGHVHRRTLLALDEEPNGALIARLIDDSQAPAAKYPLFVNTLSAGPRGRTFPHRFSGQTLMPSAYVEIDLSSAGKVLKLTHEDAGNTIPAGKPSWIRRGPGVTQPPPQPAPQQPVTPSVPLRLTF